MNFKNKIDFCIIPSPYSAGMKSLVFVCYTGANRIDEKLCLEEEYEILKNFLSHFGYQEIDFCTFESSNNSEVLSDELAQKLVDLGMRYSKSFEFNVMAELDSFHRDMSQNFGHDYDIPPIPFEEENIFFSNNVPVVPKTKVPEIGEKLSLYFYMFLYCQFTNETDCSLEIVGDLFSKDNNNTRNFLQIAKSDFIRLDSKNPHTILLQSTKTWGDLVRELNFLYKGAFKFVRPVKGPGGEMALRTREFVYDIMEIKKSINPIHKLVIEVNPKFYDEMISRSKIIKREMSLDLKKIISLDNIRPEMMLLKQKLSAKMLNLAEADEFEKANLIKSDINFIDNKLLTLDAMEEKNITQQEYFRTFCLNP